MRRLAPTLLALAFAPAAYGGDLTVAPKDFAPAARPLTVNADFARPGKVGVQLTTASGRAVGWLARPAVRSAIRLRWNGRLDGVPVASGRYRVRLVGPRRERSSAPVTIDRSAPALADLRIEGTGEPFAGDRGLLATISPNGDGYRDAASVRFRLAERATVHLEVARTVSAPFAIYELTTTLPAGRHELRWAPGADVGPRTYLIRLTVRDVAGNRRTYGAGDAKTGRIPTGPVVRVLGVDAGFTRDSYGPGQRADVIVSSDANWLQAQFFRAGPERVPTSADNVMNGVPAGETITLPWSAWRNKPRRVTFGIGPWESGLYFLRLTADDGRVGYAPFVVRPSLFGNASRVAVVLPTNTWQAYNFRDEDGNGWGDTWYAKGAQSTVRLGRPYLRRGVPPQFRKYDLAFLHWLAWTGKKVDTLAESDLELVGSGDELAAAYDLVVFPGHTEYVTRREFDLIQRYRDVGGNLAFLSANNFFWEVRREKGVLRRTRLWRESGRPEAALIGVQYRGNDDGARQRPFLITGTAAAPWLFAGTDLTDGAFLGQELGGYGIEIDGLTKDSPPGTIVLAEIPDLYGPGFTAQMAYYETLAGAKVFAAGVLDFGGSATLWSVRRLLENLWARLTAP